MWKIHRISVFELTIHKQGIIMLRTSKSLQNFDYCVGLFRSSEFIFTFGGRLRNASERISPCQTAGSAYCFNATKLHPVCDTRLFLFQFINIAAPLRALPNIWIITNTVHSQISKAPISRKYRSYINIYYDKHLRLKSDIDEMRIY